MRTLTAEAYFENEDNDGHTYRKLLRPEWVCYPYPPPDGYQGIDFDFLKVYGSLPNVGTTDEDEDDGEDGDADGDKDDKQGSQEDGGVLGNIHAKRRRTE